MAIAYSPTQQMPNELVRCWRNTGEDIQGIFVAACGTSRRKNDCL
jgi:hypothetical protein